MKAQYVKFLLAFFLIIFLFIVFQFIGIQDYINITTLKANRIYLLDIVRNHYWIAVTVYITLYILVSALSLPIAAPLTLISGFLFDVIPAVLYTNIGATIGATITFILFRYFFGSTFQRKYSEKLATFNKNVELYGTEYLLLVRFIAIIPFFLVNILAGLTKIPIKTFIITTSLGIIPGSLAYAYAGKQIITINTVRDVFSPRVVIAFVILILFSLASIIIKKWLFKKRN